jgi:FtsP/CotA-like multicopper oxidase with cupredoxin domain
MSDQNFEKNEKKENGMSRRKFLKTGAIAGGATIVGLAVGLPYLTQGKTQKEQSASSQMVPIANASFQVPLQIPLPGASIPKYVIPLAHFNNATRVTGTPIAVDMQELQQMVLPAAMYPPAPSPFAAGTWVWGYNVGGRGAHYPGFSIVATKGTSTTVNYLNSLPSGASSKVQPLVTVDQTIKWADPLGLGITTVPYTGSPPAVAHLHGGEVPSTIDGGPNAWFTADGLHQGPGYNGFGAPLNGSNYAYPNTQEAATLWFHDHCLGATRTNVYSGLAAFYLLRDTYDTGLTGNPANLPADNYEIEMAIQDRQFDTNGQLLFPDGYPAGLNGPPPNPTIHPFWIPEFLGDVIVVNGNSWPYLDVEPRRYRFRLLNGSNSRFYSLKVAAQGGGGNLPMWQIGTEGALLDAPVMIAPPNELLIAPGERADIIIDFTGQANKTFTVYNSARAPFPKGATADPQTVGQIMQFRVVTPLVGTDTSFNPATPGATLRGGAGRPPLIQRLVNPTTGTLAANVTITKTRQLTLNEVIGPGGPIEILVNNSKFAAAETELPSKGSTELWEIINLTADSHPIHLHLVQFQLMNRQAFQTNKYIKAYNAAFPGGVNPADGVTYPAGTFMPGFGPPAAYGTANADGAVGGNPAVTPFLQQKPMPPNPNEAGWKDTVIMNPGEVTRIVVRFAPTELPISGAGSPTPGTNAYSFDPTTGPGYVWHCHIVDHEDNEMMRPYHPV